MFEAYLQSENEIKIHFIYFKTTPVDNHIQAHCLSFSSVKEKSFSTERPCSVQAAETFTRNDNLL